MATNDYETRFSLEQGMRNGNAANFSASIASITIQDGAAIELPSPGVVLIVGGNNAGKTTLLKQMHGRITAGWAESGAVAPYLLGQQNLLVKGAAADAYAWLAENSHLSSDHFQRNAVSIHPSVVEVVWQNSRIKG